MKFAVIFDMDGVLLDSPHIVWIGHGAAAKEYGIKFDAEYIRTHLGTSLKNLIQEWNLEHGIDVDFEKFRKISWGVQSELLRDATPNPGIQDLLKDLYQHNIKLAVGTASMRLRVEEILANLQLTKYFSSIITATEISEHKPDPAIFLACAKQLNISPQHCFVIEDSPEGIMAARRANMYAIGYLTDFNSRESLRDAGANLIIKDFSELNYNKLKELKKIIT